MANYTNLNSLNSSLKDFEQKSVVAKDVAGQIAEKSNNQETVTRKDYFKLTTSLIDSKLASKKYSQDKQNCIDSGIEVKSSILERAQRAYDNHSYAFEVYCDFYEQFEGRAPSSRATKKQNDDLNQ